jgi:hypothetical protein
MIDIQQFETSNKGTVAMRVGLCGLMRRKAKIGHRIGRIAMISEATMACANLSDHCQLITEIPVARFEPVRRSDRFQARVSPRENPKPETTVESHP